LEKTDIGSPANGSAAVAHEFDAIGQVGDGAHHIATENDPDARRTALSFVFNGVNALSYFWAFDWNAVT
jgi:hypothetical protein